MSEVKENSRQVMPEKINVAPIDTPKAKPKKSKNKNTVADMLKSLGDD